MKDRGQTFREIMGIREAAAYLGKGERWLYELVRKGKIPAVRVGRSWILKKSLIDEWLERESIKQSQERKSESKQIPGTSFSGASNISSKK